jgi:tRNA modification GTPase
LPQSSAHHLLLLNKCDLAEHPDWQGVQALRISCHTGQGHEKLASAITEHFMHGGGELDSLAAINTRHRYALQQALDYLAAARAGLLSGLSPELMDVDLRAALDSLGSISGRIDTEDILTRVFATFCLGK